MSLLNEIIFEFSVIYGDSQENQLIIYDIHFISTEWRNGGVFKFYIIFSS